MQIRYASVYVDDQEKALKFYTEKLGFKKKADVRNGDYRWLTVVSPEGAEGVELLLEPLGLAPAKVYQKALFESGIPFTQFVTKDIDKEYARLKSMGVFFRGEPMQAGPSKIVQFDDTCGNLIQLVQLPG